VKAVEHALHPGEFELPVARLPRAPRRLADAHDRDPGLLHQLDILVETVVWHVLGIVGGAVENGVHPAGVERPILGRCGTGEEQD
jgi:hypothetical protein